MYHDKLYFRGDTQNDNYQLWESDGTPEGTRVIMPDIAPASNPLGSTYLIKVYNDALYFPADYNLTGLELWKLTTPDYSGIEQTPGVPLISVYPNPSAGKFYVRSAGNASLDIKVFNISGQLVYSGSIPGEAGMVDLSRYPSGVYVMESMTDKGIVRSKIILEE